MLICFIWLQFDSLGKTIVYFFLPHHSVVLF